MVSIRSYIALAAATTVAAIAAIWIYVLWMPMAFLESGYPIWVVKQTSIRQCDLGDVIIIGDSRPESAIAPVHLSISTSNISQGGTTPIETYYFSQRVMQCPHPPKLIIYSHGMPAYLTISDALWKTAARFGYISYGQLREIATTAEALRDSSIWSKDTGDGLRGMVRDAVYGSGFPSVFLGSLVQGQFFRRYAHNMDVFWQVTQTRGNMSVPAATHGSAIPPGKDADVERFAALPIQRYYFERTMALFAAANVPVVFLATPITPSTDRALNPGVRQAFADFIAATIRNYPNTSVGGPLFPVWADDNFGDAQHLDTIGASRFTAILDRCLNAWMDGLASGTARQPCDFTPP